MENQPQPAPQQTPASDSHAAADTRQLSLLMESLVKENRAQMADFAEAMRLRDQLSVRIGSRTTQIIRFSAAALVVMGTGMIVLILTLINHMSEITLRMDEMTAHMSSMRGNFEQVAANVNNMDYKIGMIDGKFGTLTNQMGYMSRDVNTMSSPMRMMPFRP
jgi:hypothetical protein